MAEAWYVLRSKPNKEDALFRLCVSRGYKVYYPRLRVRPVDPRSRVIRPMFPGYLFLHEDLERTGLSKFQWIPHAIGLVTFGTAPGRVPNSFMNALKDRVQRMNDDRRDPLSDWHKGDPVIIRSGPLEGFEGIFDSRLSGRARVRILMKLLNDQWTKVEIEHTSLEKKKDSRGNSRR